MTTSTAPRVPPSRRRVATRALVAVGAVSAAVAVWAIAVPVLGLSVTVPDSPGSTNRSELAFLPVVLTAAVAALAGWGLLAVLERVTRRAPTVWTAIALTVFLLTLPYLPGFTGTERLVLTLLHLALAAVLIIGMRLTTRRAE